MNSENEDQLIATVQKYFQLRRDLRKVQNELSEVKTLDRWIERRSKSRTVDDVANYGNNFEMNVKSALLTRTFGDKNPWQKLVPPHNGERCMYVAKPLCEYLDAFMDTMLMVNHEANLEDFVNMMAWGLQTGLIWKDPFAPQNEHVMCLHRWLFWE